MKILILSQYYPPETGAPQNRLSSLAKHLTQLGCTVSILTAMPNYPKGIVQDGYRGKWSMKEVSEGITIYRSSIYVSKSNAVISRLLNYFSFVFSSIFTGLFRVPKHDIVFCESPPLFLGISAIVLTRIRGSKLIFNVSDLWPESAEKLGVITNKFLLNLATRLEVYLYRKAWIVTGQTQGIIKDIVGRVHGVKTYWLPNGIDFSYFRTSNEISAWAVNNGFATDDKIIMYAGILGTAQGLEVIVKAAALVNNKKYKFVIIGDGPEKQKLLDLTKNLNVENVYFFPNQKRENMPSIINSCHIFIVPLKKLDIFKGAIPSKLFEPLAFKKPIILGVEGEAKQLFIDDAKAGLAFEPENERALANCIIEILNNEERAEGLGENGFNFVKEHFNRETIAGNFYKFLINTK